MVGRNFLFNRKLEWYELFYLEWSLNGGKSLPNLFLLSHSLAFSIQLKARVTFDQTISKYCYGILILQRARWQVYKYMYDSDKFFKNKAWIK